MNVNAQRNDATCPLVLSANAEENGENYTLVLNGSFERLLHSECFSDFTLKCRQYTFRVHKMVLCNYSQFFDMVCNGAFRQAPASEFDLSADCPGHVARLVLALYTGSYDQEGEVREILASSIDPEAGMGDMLGAESAGTTHAHMYVLGERFLIPALKSLARELFATDMRRVDRRLSELTAAIRTVYDLTTDGDNALRNVVVYEAQMGGSDYRLDPGFKELIRTCHDFAADMLLICRKKNRVWCRRCERHLTLRSCVCGWTGQCKGCVGLHMDVSRFQCPRCNQINVISLEAPVGMNGKRCQEMEGE